MKVDKCSTAKTASTGIGAGPMTSDLLETSSTPPAYFDTPDLDDPATF